jgi:tRNA(adenine34) deaminase
MHEIMTTDADQQFMRQALALARTAEEQGEVPVGAVLVADGEVVGQGANAPISQNDPTAHAEIIAMREAAVRAGNYRLPDTTLYVTLEPCSMCAGAIVHARVARLVFACEDPRSGAAGTVFNLTQSDALNHRVEVTQGVLEDESRELLQAFFRARR